MKREPALIIGAVTTVVVAVLTFVAGGGAMTWAAIAPVVAAALIRQFVTPAGKATDGVTVHVGGKVADEKELVEIVRKGLIRQQRGEK